MFLSLKVTELLAQNQANRGAAELGHHLTMKTHTLINGTLTRTKPWECFWWFFLVVYSVVSQLLLWVPIMLWSLITVQVYSILVPLSPLHLLKGQKIDQNLK